MTQQELLRLHMLTNAIRIENGLLIYGMCRFRLRPTVAATLRFLIASPGEPIAVRRLCQAVYGHALTLRAIRQTAFRISRAMDNVNCPLAALCQAGTVFLRPKTWHFERGSPSSQ